MNTTHQKTWSRGRKRQTPQQRKQSEQYQKTRVRIANLVRRRTNLKTNCVVCGKPGHIMHNKENPYFISFICDECSKDSSKIKEAESKRFNLCNNIIERTRYATDYSEQEVIHIIENYLSVNNILPIEDYCKSIDVSRYIFNLLIKRYEKIEHKRNIHTLIKNKTNSLRAHKLVNIRNKGVIV